MKRRHWLLAGVAGAAAGAGAYWQQRRAEPDLLATVPAPTASAPAATAKAADDPVWSLAFETPDGGSLALASFKGRPLLLNFWATWCPPCVKEFPLLDRFARDHAASGWQVLGLALDRRDPVREFLQRLPVVFPVALAGLQGAELLRTLGNGTGALPYSLTFDANGSVRHRKLGELTAAELSAWASARS